MILDEKLFLCIPTWQLKKTVALGWFHNEFKVSLKFKVEFYF